MTSRLISLFMIALMCLSCGNDNILTYEKIEEVEVYPDVWVDSFIQPIATDGYDILWVIDRSGSMGNHDAELLLGIEAMMNALPIDTGWRLGVISADGNYSVSNTTFPLVPGDDIVDATAALDALQGSYYGPPGEEGFEAVYSYVTLGSYAATWMRPTAALLVVFVSDEEEQSMWEVSDFSSYLSTIRSRTFVASIVGIGSSTCADQIGERYLELTQNFGGNEIDICSSDWTQGVEEASKAYEPIDSLELSEVPEEGSIVVFIDGIPQPNPDWEFNEPTNTIYFLVVPADGTLVEVAYFLD
jgi:hypothetical protein